MRDRDLDDFPPGTWVQTPTGLVGRIDGARGDQSKHDHFIRVVVRFSDRPRDTLALQPKLLKKLDKSPDPDGGESTTEQ